VIAGGAAGGRSSGVAIEEIAKKLSAGIGYEWSGLSYEERLSGAQAPVLYAISLHMVFLCLAALYESCSIPPAVLIIVPLGVIARADLTIFTQAHAQSLNGLVPLIGSSLPDNFPPPPQPLEQPDRRFAGRGAVGSAGSAARRLVQARQARLTNLVNLYKVLGRGWRERTL
jgi:hypothetical protein